jgi:hypothetical protein
MRPLLLRSTEVLRNAEAPARDPRLGSLRAGNRLTNDAPLNHLPPRSTVHGWIKRWNCDRVLDRLDSSLYQQVCKLDGR